VSTANRSTRDILRIDLAHMVEPDGRSGLWRRMDLLVRLAVFPRLRTVVYYRWGQALARRGLLPLAYWLESRAIRGSGAEINPLAQIGPGLCLMHTVGIVVGPQVRVGERAIIYQGVTLGDGSVPGQPTIGDDVMIGAGAAVLGGITVGNRVVIGAHAVVTRDLPDDCVAVGAPATWRPRTTSAAPHA